MATNVIQVSREYYIRYMRILLDVFDEINNAEVPPNVKFDAIIGN